MAEARDEEIIIIEENDVANADNDTSEEELELDEEAKKKKIIIFGGIAVILVLIIVITLLLLLKSSQNKEDNSFTFIEDKLQENKQIKIEPSKLENMIAKANYLYSSGSKDKALYLYRKIAQYSEAISLYNLGVAQLKDKQYKVAQETFQKAIQNDEKRCVSAINAAVCSLHLDDQESFRYYIDLAYAYLANEANSPLYSYYYALINYYNNNYLESLSALKNTSSDEYPYIQKNLMAKVSALFGNDYDAIEAMEGNFEDSDDFSIAILYARVGDFTLAKSHLEEAILKNIQPVKAQLALGLINLKAGQIPEATREIKNVSDMFPKDVHKIYPIKVLLKSSLFNAKQAQNDYRKRIENSKLLNYQKIFYFSAYKIFNANQTISYIRRGNANIFIDDVKSAKNYLQHGVTSSNVNAGMTHAIKKALSFKLREANEEFKKLVKMQPKHSILQYNLALTYAQMGDIQKAHEHFLRSYYLDAKNYLSATYAIMCSQIIGKENSKLISIVRDSVADETQNEEITFYKTLLQITKNDYISAIEWLHHDYKDKPIYLALQSIIALKLNKAAMAQEATQKLTRLLPHEILPHMLYIDAYYGDLENLKYASKVLNYLKKQNFSFQDLYYGPYITRYLYIQQNLITGKLYYLAKQLEEVLDTHEGNKQDIISSLAMVYLFDKSFEKSYTLYNLLIDELKIRDSYTLFLGAIASTAAEHHSNAIALLELANIKNPNFDESRYALGLLYLEIKNNSAAVIQFGHIDKDNFISEYIDFEIDVDALLYNKLHPQKEKEVPTEEE